MSEGKWVGVSEASRLVGVSQQAIRGRVQRNTIDNRLDNRGRIQVCIKDEDTTRNNNVVINNVEQENNNIAQHENAETERLYNIIQGQQRTIDNLTDQMDKGQAERREVLSLLAKAQDVILDLKEQNKVAVDRNRRALTLFKDHAKKA